MQLATETVTSGLTLEHAHPADEQLWKYASGRLDEAGSEPIEQHLKRCSRCCARLAQGTPLDRDDPFVWQLRLADKCLQLQNGGTLGDYRLLRIIGQGGMGIVYEAIQQSLGRPVALKILPLADNHDAEALRRFHREARAAAALRHPNIVPVYEIGETADCQFFAMQLIQGCSLAELFADACEAAAAPGETAAGDPVRLLSPMQVAEMGRQVASALAHAHARGVVHRDIKPSNLLRDDDGVVWVVDFGSAMFGDDDLTQTGQLIGTLPYLAPERVHGEADERCDIYALGVTLYELLVRRRLLDTTNRLQAIDRILHDVPVPPRQIDPTIPKDLETIILRAIAKDPQQRYQTAAGLAEDLQRFCDGQPIASRRIGLTSRFSRTIGKHPRSIGRQLATLLLLLLSGLMLVVYLQSLQNANRQLARTLQATNVTTRLALQSARDAQQASQQWQKALVQSYLADAATLINQGAALAALPHLCNALELEPETAAQQRQRMRIGAILDHSPRPLLLWQHDGPIRQLRLSEDATQLFVRTATGHLQSWPTGISPAAPPETAQSQVLAGEAAGADSPAEPTQLGEHPRPLNPLGAGEFFSAYLIAPPAAPPAARLQWLEPIRIAQRSNDGSQVAIAGSGNFVSLADSSGNEPQPLQLPTPAPPSALAFSADDRLLAVGSTDGTVQLWELATPGCAVLPVDDLLAALACSQDTQEPSEPLLELAPELVQELTKGFPLGFHALCADEDRDSQLVVFGGRWGQRGGCVQVWDTATHTPITPVILQPVAVSEVTLDASAAAAAYRCLDGISGQIRFAATDRSLEQLRSIAGGAMAILPPPRPSLVPPQPSLYQLQHDAGLPQAEVDAWRLQRLDDALRRGDLLTAQRRLEALPAELLSLPRAARLRSAIAEAGEPLRGGESPDAASRSGRSDGYP